ncbi:MAG: hypothetical protein E7336_12625 [Clostridiales bacterium]|nr:hypothetical protein [Clostridiales bacterium]
MMKRQMAILVLLFFVLCLPAYCEEEANWNTAPVFTKAYELSAEKLYVEWNGSATLYQVFVDGELKASTIVNNSILAITKGTHNITIYPIYEKENVDTKVDVGLEVFNIGGSVGLDLAALGVNPQKLVAGTPSLPLTIDYRTDTIFNAVPDKLTAATDFEDRVLLSFVDRYNADEYLVAIKSGKDVNYVSFYPGRVENAELIKRVNSTITLTLDQDYLEKQGCMIPELNEKYTFTVQLRKYATNLLNGEKESTMLHESQISNYYEYTPVAAWKEAPVILYASQTADGQAMLRWTHVGLDYGCEYQVVKNNKILGIKRDEEILSQTSATEYVLNDLMNGNYSFEIVPVYGSETGFASQEVTIDIKNDWVIAPDVSIEQTDGNKVKINWMATEGVETYHVCVYVGDNESILRYVNLDYSKYQEYDVAAIGNSMESEFVYEGEIDPVDGVRLKFEIYGVRHASDGSEQKTAVTTQTIVIK